MKWWAPRKSTGTVSISLYKWDMRTAEAPRLPAARPGLAVQNAAASRTPSGISNCGGVPLGQPWNLVFEPYFFPPVDLQGLSGEKDCIFINSIRYWEIAHSGLDTLHLFFFFFSFSPFSPLLLQVRGNQGLHSHNNKNKMDLWKVKLVTLVVS